MVRSEAESQVDGQSTAEERASGDEGDEVASGDGEGGLGGGAASGSGATVADSGGAADNGDGEDDGGMSVTQIKMPIKRTWEDDAKQPEMSRCVSGQGSTLRAPPLRS